MGQQVQPVHHEAEVGAGLSRGGVGVTRLRAPAGAEEALGKRPVLVVVAQLAQQPARPVRPAPGSAHEQ